MATSMNFAYGLFVACMLSGTICLIAAIYYFQKSVTLRQKLSRATRSKNAQKKKRTRSKSLELDIDGLSNHIENDSEIDSHPIASARSSKHDKILSQHMLNHFSYADLQSKWKHHMQQNDIDRAIINPYGNNDDTEISNGSETSCVLKNIPHQCTQTKKNAYATKSGDQRIVFTNCIRKHRDFVW